MATARTLINAALRQFQGVSRDAVLSAEDSADALEALNAMLNSWEGENLLVPNWTDDPLTLTVGKRTYTYGTGGDLDSERPISIDAIVLDPVGGGSRYPLYRMGVRERSQVYDPSLSVRPDRYFYNPKFPLGELEFDSTPSEADVLTITAIKPLADIASLDTEVSLPPMYQAAIRFNLPVYLAPEYGRSLKPETVALATRTLNTIRALRASETVPVLDVDRGLTGVDGDSYDIQGDTHL